MRAERARYVRAGLAGLLAFGLLALVLWLAEPARTLATLARVGPWEAAALVATAFGVSAFTALAWRAVLARWEHDVPVWLLFRLVLLAFAAGFAIPSGFVAGIPVAAWFLGRRGVPFTQALASFGVGRFLEISAYALVLPLTLATGVRSLPVVRVLAGAIPIALLLVYLDLFYGWRLVRRALRRVEPLLPRFTERAVHGTAAVCTDVSDFFRGPLHLVVLATAFSFVAIGVAFVRALLANAFLGLHLATAQVALMFAITIFVMAVPFLPGAIGAYEGGIVGAFRLLGRSESDGLAYALTIHATELAVVAAGLVVLAHLGVRGAMPQPAASRATGICPGGRRH